jgi:hypothetical protein
MPIQTTIRLPRSGQGSKSEGKGAKILLGTSSVDNTHTENLPKWRRGAYNAKGASCEQTRVNLLAQRNKDETSRP